jgi:hypothetical protein
LRIHSGMVYSHKRGLEKYSFEAMKETQTFRDKPFFTCYLKEL